MKTLGDRLKYLRTKKGLKQAELGKLLGVSGSHISRIENNIVPADSNNLFAIQQIFNISIDWLLTGENNNSNTDPNLSSADPDFCELYEMYTDLPIKDKIDVSTYIKVRYSILKENEMLSTLTTTNESEEENNIA